MESPHLDAIFLLARVISTLGLVKMTFFMSLALRHAFVDVHFKVALHVFSGHGATDSSASEGYRVCQVVVD